MYYYVNCVGLTDYWCVICWCTGQKQ